VDGQQQVEGDQQDQILHRVGVDDSPGARQVPGGNSPSKTTDQEDKETSVLYDAISRERGHQRMESEPDDHLEVHVQEKERARPKGEQASRRTPNLQPRSRQNAIPEKQALLREERRQEQRQLPQNWQVQTPWDRGHQYFEREPRDHLEDHVQEGVQEQPKGSPPSS
jgi:hypothetical protein